MLVLLLVVLLLEAQHSMRRMGHVPSPTNMLLQDTWHLGVGMAAWHGAGLLLLQELCLMLHNMALHQHVLWLLLGLQRCCCMGGLIISKGGPSLNGQGRARGGSPVPHRAACAIEGSSVEAALPLRLKLLFLFLLLLLLLLRNGSATVLLDCCRKRMCWVLLLLLLLLLHMGMMWGWLTWCTRVRS